MPIENQKTINHGGKHSGKILGGMSFRANDAVTDVGIGNIFVRIGNGGAAGLVPFSLYQPNQYFIILGDTVQNQTLQMQMGSYSNLYLNWELCVKSTGPVDQINLSFRIRKIRAVTGAISTIVASQISGRATPNGTSVGCQNLVFLDIRDQIYIELSNVDIDNPTQDVIVSSARMIVSE